MYVHDADGMSNESRRNVGDMVYLELTGNTDRKGVIDSTNLVETSVKDMFTMTVDKGVTQHAPGLVRMDKNHPLTVVVCTTPPTTDFKFPPVLIIQVFILT